MKARIAPRDIALAGEIFTLDEAWREAARLGEPSIERNWVDSARGALKGQIKIETAGGSTIWACGFSNDPISALIGAIAEARGLLG